MSSSERFGNAGMPACGRPFLDDGTDFLALLIVQHRDGSQQVRSLRAASGWPVAGAAILLVEGLALLGRGRIGGGSQAQKLASPFRATRRTAGAGRLPVSRGG